MNFNLQRHTRLAGTVAVFVGLAMKNWSVVLFGWAVVFVGFSWTINKLEQAIEAKDKPEVNKYEND